jgi:hypothetical protein
MHFEFWASGLKFITIFLIVVGTPCFIVSVLGTRLINRLGQFPSQSAKMQLGVCLGLLLTEVFSLTALALFFKVFSE